MLDHEAGVQVEVSSGRNSGGGSSDGSLGGGTLLVRLAR